MEGIWGKWKYTGVVFRYHALSSFGLGMVHVPEESHGVVAFPRLAPKWFLCVGINIEHYYYNSSVQEVIYQFPAW